MFIQEHNCETGEIKLRELTAEEIAHNEKILEQFAAEKTKAQAKAQAKAQLLAQLGITEEQAKLLLS